MQSERTNAMMVLSEGYGYTLIFKDKNDLENAIRELENELKSTIGVEKLPPYVISFYTDNGVSSEYMKTHLTDLKKRFKNAK